MIEDRNRLAEPLGKLILKNERILIRTIEDFNYIVYRLERLKIEYPIAFGKLKEITLDR